MTEYLDPHPYSLNHPPPYGNVYAICCLGVVLVNLQKCNHDTWNAVFICIRDNTNATTATIADNNNGSLNV